MLPSSLILVVDEDTFSRPALVFILAFKFNRCLAVASFARIRAFALVRSLNVDVALFSAKATKPPLKKAEKKTHKDAQRVTHKGHAQSVHRAGGAQGAHRKNLLI